MVRCTYKIPPSRLVLARRRVGREEVEKAGWRGGNERKCVPEVAPHPATDFVIQSRLDFGLCSGGSAQEWGFRQKQVGSARRGLGFGAWAVSCYSLYGALYWIFWAA